MGSKIRDLSAHPEQGVWDTLLYLAPNLVTLKLAEAWDQGYAAKAGDRNPYREAGA